MKTVNLYELERQYHTVALQEGGPKHRVRPVTGRIASVIAAAEVETDTRAKMRLYYDAAALILPSVSRDDVEDLTFAQLAEIMTLSRTQVDVIEAAAGVAPDPNAASPTTESSSGDTPATS